MHVESPLASVCSGSELFLPHSLISGFLHPDGPFSPVTKFESLRLSLMVLELGALARRTVPEPIPRTNLVHIIISLENHVTDPLEVYVQICWGEDAGLRTQYHQS